MEADTQITGAAIIQRLLHLCLRPDDQKLLARLAELPEFQFRHQWLAENANPMPRDWWDFASEMRNRFNTDINRAVAYDALPGYAYNNTPAANERRRRLMMLFGLPEHRIESSWGDTLTWCLSSREFWLFSGLADWRKVQLAAKAEGKEAE